MSSSSKIPKIVSDEVKKDDFMEVAYLESQNSNDPRTQVGACIVNKENSIVGRGYNCMPRGCEKFSWEKNTDTYQCKLTYVCHAEMNAILNKTVLKLDECRMYVTLFPCTECAKLIVQSGIRKVYFESDKNWKNQPRDTKDSREIFGAADVEVIHMPMVTKL